MIGNNHGTWIGALKKVKFLGVGEKKIAILTVMYGKPRESNNSDVDFVNAVEVRVSSHKMGAYANKLEEMKKIIEAEDGRLVTVIVDGKAQGKTKDVAGESVLYADISAEKLTFDVTTGDKFIGYNHLSLTGEVKSVDIRWGKDKKTGSAILTFLYGPQKDKAVLKIIEAEDGRLVTVIVDGKAQGKTKDVAGESVLYADISAEKLTFDVTTGDKFIGYNHLSLTGEVKSVDIRWGKDKKTGSAILTFLYGPQKDKAVLKRREAYVNAIYIRIPTYKFEAYRNKLLALEKQMSDNPELIVRAVADAHVQGVLKRVLSTGSLITEIIADRVVFEWDLDAEANTPTQEDVPEA